MRKTLVTLLALLTLPACVAMTEEELARQRGAERISIDTSRTWTYPVTFHDASFAFEILPDEKFQLALPSPELDVIGIHASPPRGVGFGYGRFHIQAQTHTPHRGATFYIFRVPAVGSEWVVEGPPVTISWQADGQVYPVEERYNELVERPHPNPRKKILMAPLGPTHHIWTIAGTRIHHRPDGTVEVKRARDVRTLYAPSTIRLGPGGEILALE